MLTESEKKIAEAIDVYSYFISGKSIADTIPFPLDKDFIEAYGKYRVAFAMEDLGINFSNQEAVLLVAEVFASGYFAGLYMAEAGKAKLGPSAVEVS